MLTQSSSPDWNSTKTRHDLEGKGTGRGESVSPFGALLSLLERIQGYQPRLRNALDGLRDCQDQLDLLEELTAYLLRPRKDRALVTSDDFWDNSRKLCQKLKKLPCFELPPDCPEQIADFNAAVEKTQIAYKQLFREIDEEMPSAEADIKATWAEVLELHRSLDDLQTRATELKQIYYDMADGYLTRLDKDAVLVVQTLTYVRKEMQEEVRASAQDVSKPLSPAAAVAEDRKRIPQSMAPQSQAPMPPGVRAFIFTLSGDQIGVLVASLGTAFDEAEFAQLLVRLDHPLEQIGAQNANLPTTMTAVIRAALRQGWIEQLLDAVSGERPDRPDIQEIIQEMRQSARQRVATSTQNATRSSL